MWVKFSCTRKVPLILCTVLSFIIIGCGQDANNTNSISPAEKKTVAEEKVEKTQEKKDHQSEQKVEKTQEKKDYQSEQNENGKVVTDSMLQSIRDSVTDDEMKLFTEIAKINRYTESQVRDFVARMKIVGIDLSMLTQGEKLPEGFYFRIDKYNRKTSEGNLCFLYDCSVRVSTKKDDKTKVTDIFIAYQHKSNPMYTLYKDDIIVGDFSDMFLTPEARENLIATVNDYVSSRSGNLKDNGIPITHAHLTVKKDDFSDGSTWRGGNNKEFGFIIPYSEIRYTVPSEVYGEKEKEKYSVFLFNKNGELLIAFDYPYPNGNERGNLIRQAVEKVKL